LKRLDLRGKPVHGSRCDVFVPEVALFDHLRLDDELVHHEVWDDTVLIAVRVIDKVPPRMWCSAVAMSLLF